MKKFALLALLAVVTPLAACHGRSTSTAEATTKENGVVHVMKTTQINGVKSGSNLVLSDFALRARLGNNPTSAGYVTIKNDGKAEDRLVSASCTCASKVTLHTMSMANGQMSMAEKPEGFVIRAGETIVFAPGGNHIMLDGVTTALNDGGTQAVVLHFEKAGDVTLDMPISSTPLAGKAAAHDAMKM